MSRDDIIGEAVQEEEALVACQAVVQLVLSYDPSGFNGTDNTEPNTLACGSDHTSFEQGPALGEASSFIGQSVC